MWSECDCRTILGPLRVGIRGMLGETWRSNWAFKGKSERCKASKNEGYGAASDKNERVLRRSDFVAIYKSRLLQGRLEAKQKVFNTYRYGEEKVVVMRDIQ